MKILQINAVKEVSSTGRTCKEFSDYINNFTEGACYTAFSQGEVDSFSYQIGNTIEKKMHAFMSRLTGKQGHFSKIGTLFLIDYIKRLNPTTVILRNIHSNFINFPMLLNYLIKTDIPLILVLDDCWYFTGKCTHFTLDNCYKWKTGCNSCTRLKKDNKSWLIDATSILWREKKNLFQKVRKLSVVGVSDWISNEANNSILRDAINIETIYNWVDFKIFKPYHIYNFRNNIEEKKFIILGVASSWTVNKGLNYFIKLSKMIPKNMSIVLVGKVPKNYILPKSIKIINETNSLQKLVEYYNTADVFLNMSLEETFGKVSAEALACGTPIVCFNSTANPELCGTGCGYICDKGNLQEVLLCLKKIEGYGKQKYSNRCIEFAKENFDKEKNLSKWLNLIEEIERLN